MKGLQKCNMLLAADCWPVSRHYRVLCAATNCRRSISRFITADTYHRPKHCPIHHFIRRILGSNPDYTVCLVSWHIMVLSKQIRLSLPWNLLSFVFNSQLSLLLCLSFISSVLPHYVRDSLYNEIKSMLNRPAFIAVAANTRVYVLNKQLRNADKGRACLPCYIARDTVNVLKYSTTEYKDIITETCCTDVYIRIRM